MIDETADAARRALAAKELLTVPRRERGLCSVVLAERWTEQAPRCPERATRYICTDTYATGFWSDERTFHPGESMARVCDTHEAQARAMVETFHWSTPLDPMREILAARVLSAEQQLDPADDDRDARHLRATAENIRTDEF